MMYLAAATLDRWIKDDMPYLDLTTHVLGMPPPPRRPVSTYWRHPPFTTAHRRTSPRRLSCWG
jgi:hypothetical protein